MVTSFLRDVNDRAAYWLYQFSLTGFPFIFARNVQRAARRRGLFVQDVPDPHRPRGHRSCQKEHGTPLPRTSGNYFVLFRQ